ncbi:thiamine biosynthesis multifunctional protein ThiED [Folsomia candida]|nr:thiamine biosynthesis multifunctional protein ThiED [Folsomia candida]
MLHAYTRSVYYQFKFAETVLALEPAFDPVPTFTDLVDLHVTPDAQAGVVNHALFREIVGGTLPLDRFAVMVQQGDNWMKGFYGAMAYMERKETDKELKQRLHKDSGYVDSYFDRVYEKYDIPRPYFAEEYTKAYLDHIISKSHHASIAEGLAAVYPSYFLWNRIGTEVNKLARNVTNHPYMDFVQFNNPAGSKSLAKFQSLINTYFEELDGDLETKWKMFQVVGDSILYEGMLANGEYRIGRPQGF